MKTTPTTFPDFLKAKKIDPLAFEKNEPESFQKFCAVYLRIGYANFDQQKKFLINDWRLAYPESSS